jgi:hypothetical protein
MFWSPQNNSHGAIAFTVLSSSSACLVDWNVLDTIAGNYYFQIDTSGRKKWIIFSQRCYSHRLAHFFASSLSTTAVKLRLLQRDRKLVAKSPQESCDKGVPWRGIGIDLTRPRAKQLFQSDSQWLAGLSPIDGPINRPRGVSLTCEKSVMKRVARREVLRYGSEDIRVGILVQLGVRFSCLDQW